MKNIKKILALVLCTLALTTIFGVANPNVLNGVSLVNYRFEINGEEVTVPKSYYIMSKNNTTYVPLRFVSENLGSMVKFEKGKITIEDARYMRDLETGVIKPIEANRRLLDDTLKEVERLKKENEALKTQISRLEKQYDSVKAYKKLPTGETDTFGFSVRLDSVVSVNDKATLNIVLENKDKDNIFYFLPEKTEVTLGNRSTSSIKNITTNLHSALMPYTSREGLSSIAGEIAFDLPYEKDVTGSVTFYYRVNGSVDVRTMTLHFDTKK